MEATVTFILLSTLLTSVSAMVPCDSVDDEIKQNCKCQENYMMCSNLKNLPSLLSITSPAGVAINQVVITDSSFGKLEKESLDDYDEVEMLMLDKCEITAIGDNAFASTPRLLTLEMKSNRIINITKRMFNGLDQLKELHLSSNLIEKIPEDFLSSFSELTELHLSYNKGLKLNEKFFAGSSIKRLSLHHTGLTAIPTKMLSYAENLIQIGLHGNLFNNITAHAFVGLAELEEIGLAYNNISKIDDEAFVGLPKLKTLILRNNKIKELTPEMMDPIGDTLETLFIDNNLLTTLHTNVIRHEKIVQVRLGHNPWVCDCEIKWMKDLDLKHRDPENVTCANEEFKGHPLSNVTEEMLCTWCQGCSKSKLAYAIGIPILIISAFLMGYYIYRLIQSRRQHAQLRKVYKYSNVYRDTVEPVHSNVPPSQRA